MPHVIDYDKAYELYTKRGMTLREVAAKLGCSASALSIGLRARGVTARRTGPKSLRGGDLTDADTKSIIDAYSVSRTSMSQLAADYHISRACIRAVLAGAGVDIRRRWSPRRKETHTSCIDCGQPIDPRASGRDSSQSDGRTPRCKLCQRRYARYLKYRLTHGMTQHLLSSQADSCGISRGHLDEYTLRVDHCHVTNSVRGLLCNSCNLALGYVQDSPATLYALARYLWSPYTPLVAQPTGVYSLYPSPADNHRYYCYGVTKEAYDGLVKSQGGVCAVCASFTPTTKFPSLLIEHCHRTRRIRGLVCHSCNRAISLFYDNPWLAVFAAQYLTSNA